MSAAPNRQASTMRLMMMHKSDPKTEAGLPPPMELVHRMGAFIGELAATGRLVDGAGPAGSPSRTRLRFRDGQCTTKHGPMRERTSFLPRRFSST